MSEQSTNYKLLRNIALVAATFGAVVCILIIANYFQINRIDPVNTDVINQLVNRLNDNPGDEQLRIQIREMDLLARKAYFTNQWQVKTGGYLILIALAIFIIAYQIMDANIKKQVMVNPDAPKDILGIQKNARIGISIIGGSMVLVALLLSFLTHNKLNENIELAKTANADKNTIEVSPESVEYVVEIQEKELLDEVPKSSENELVVDKKPVENIEKTEVKKKATQVIPSQPKKKGAISFPTIDELKKNAATFRGFYANGIVYQDNVPQSWNGITNKNILWKSEVPVQGYNSPIVWGNKIFLSGATPEVREVFCFDKGSGKLVWRTKIENIKGSPATAPKTTSDTGLAAPTMTTDGNYVYAIFGTGDIVAIDMDGKVIWGKNLGVPQNHYGHSSSLIMYEDKLIVQYDQKSNPKVMALNALTGNEVWSTERKVKISWASPILINFKGEVQVVLASDPSVAAYNPETGKEIWSVDCIFGEVGPSVCYAD